MGGRGRGAHRGQQPAKRTPKHDSQRYLGQST